MNKEGLLLCPAGRLMRTQWIYDDATDQGSYVETDVTDSAHTFLFDTVELHQDVKLADVFTLLAGNAVLQAMQKRNFVESLLKECKNTTPQPYTGEYDPDGIEYLEIYHVWEKDPKTLTLNMSWRPHFHGIGFPLRADTVEMDSTLGKVGDRISWGIGFSTLAALLNLPLRLNMGVTVCDADAGSSTYGSALEVLQLDSIPLGAVLESILWELSFYGAAEDRDAAKNELAHQLEDANRDASIMLSDAD